jgi:hypothetical protein
MRDTRYFPDELDTRFYASINGSRIDQLICRFRYVSSYGTIEVPVGALSDGASIPKIFWPILGPYGPYFRSAVVHDFLYSDLNDEFTRAESDLIFKEAMFNEGIGWCQRETIYRAVRLFGKKHFKGKLTGLT